jgi:hypothetical protein
MSYTNTKVTYIGTNEEEIELEKKGVKPDYYQYDQDIANGNIKTNYDNLQTTWYKDGITNTTSNRSHMGENQYSVSGGYFNEWLGYADENFTKIRPDYNPRERYVVKGVHFKSEQDDNTANTAENTPIPHYGNSNNTTSRNGHLTNVNGLYANYTPVLNDSLIKISCRYTAYSVNGSYPIWLWSLFIANRWITGGWERHYAMGTKTIHHEVYCNSWGSGKQLEVTFGFNSYNNSHRAGIYTNNLPAYSRYFSIEEYRNANPYGPAVMAWTRENAQNL